MKRFFVALALFLAALSAYALQPYVTGTKVTAGDLAAAATAVEQKLTAAGFTVVGREMAKGLPAQATVVVTDAGLTEVLKGIGGTAVVAIPVRVGVKSDGTVSYVNLEYWQRAYLRKDYGKAEAAVKAAAGKLEQALGTGAAFGGDIKAEDLANYHYMFGMERFDEKTLLAEYKSFEQAVKTVQDNLAKGVKGTAKVYELVYPDRKLAVFGVTMNDAEHGEGWWVNKIGADHVAALPWEVFVVDGKVMALFGRYRTALAWPSLGMGQFMTISNHPDTTKAMLDAVAGAQ
ncbi:MAG TPA: hypothetical protein VMC81_02310 [Rhodocyclaceae bacterium]|nr:hypothetical protein [Rhodocyclaceae bacterium]